MRNVVTLTRYGLDDSTEKSFDLFRTILNDKLLVMNGELAPLVAAGQTLPALTSFYTGSEKPSTQQEMDQYWAATRSLQILQGTITRPAALGSGEPPRVKTRFNLLGNARDLSPPSVVVDLRLDDSQFNYTVDTHSAVVLYSLAVEASRNPKHRASALAMLGVFMDKLASLERSGALGADMSRLKRAAAALAEELRRK